MEKLNTVELKQLLASESDIKATNTIRAILLDRYKATHKVNSISPIDDEMNTEFCSYGCDICRQGASEVYSTHGYSAKYKKILELGAICHDCLCVEYNGID